MAAAVPFWLSMASYFALCSGMDQNIIWTRNNTFEGYKSSGLIQVKARTKSDCAMRCTVIGTAVAFFYDKDHEACQCLDATPLTLNGLLTSSSSKYFVAEGPRCTDGFTFENSIHCCFRIFTEMVNYTDALSVCSQYNGTLLRLENERKHTFFAQFLKLSVYSNFDYFVDGSDAINETEWLSSEGSRMSYMPFAPGEPTDWYSDFEDCIVLSRVRDFNLNDIPCEYKYRFICEKH